MTITGDDVEVTVEMQTDDTAVDQLDPIDLQLYPNPASDFVTVEAEKPIDEVRVVDMLGKTIFSAWVGEQQYELAVGSMRPGVYFVQVIAGEQTETLRLRVSR